MIENLKDEKVYLEAHQYLVEAQNAVAQNHVYKSVIILKKCLEEYPEFGQGHNYLAWNYVMLEKYVLAERHYLEAINRTPAFTSSYINYLILLNSLERYDDFKALFPKACNITGIRKDIIYGEYAMVLEKLGEYKNAIQQYKMSIRYSFVKADIEFMKKAIERCQLKLEIF